MRECLVCSPVVCQLRFITPQIVRHGSYPPYTVLPSALLTWPLRTPFLPLSMFALINSTKCQWLLARVCVIKDGDHLTGHDFDKGN